MSQDFKYFGGQLADLYRGNPYVTIVSGMCQHDPSIKIASNTEFEKMIFGYRHDYAAGTRFDRSNPFTEDDLRAISGVLRKHNGNMRAKSFNSDFKSTLNADQKASLIAHQRKWHAIFRDRIQ